jgi:chaperonin GroES
MAAKEPIQISKPKARYQPMNDRVLLRRIVEKSESLIVQPDAFTLKSNKGEVIAVGSGMLIGQNIVPIDLKPGDVVTFGEYNSEEIGKDEDAELLLVSAFDIRLKILA